MTRAERSICYKRKVSRKINHQFLNHLTAIQLSAQKKSHKNIEEEKTELLIN